MIFNFNTKPGVSQVEIDAMTYWMDVDQSWNVPSTSGFIVEAQTTSRSFQSWLDWWLHILHFFHENSNKKNNTQNDHQQPLNKKWINKALSPIYACLLHMFENFCKSFYDMKMDNLLNAINFTVEAANYKSKVFIQGVLQKSGHGVLPCVM